MSQIVAGEPPSTPMSVSAFARWRGVSHTAVQRRIAAGNLPTAAKKIKGTWMIVDPVKAVEEWENHTRPRVLAAKNGQNGAATPSGLARETERERKNRADILEFDLKRKTGEYVKEASVEMRWSAIIVGARTTMLSWPTRAKQRLPHLTVADLAVLDQLVREVLEELASEEPKGETA
jgi:hypothetical protein